MSPLMPQSWHDSIARTNESLERFKAGERRYWYFISSDYCPVCGKDDTTRERIYGERPSKWEDRHDYDWNAYDYCDVM